MIRRDVHRPDGASGWILISQIEHARLAGELARYWGNEPVRAVDDDEVLWTIVHHDDGWSQWEQAPGVEQPSGRPLDFTEMPPETALAIWRKSILAAADHGNLAPWLVAGHFSALLAHSHAAHSDAAKGWLAEFQQRRKAWLAAWKSDSPDSNTLERAAANLSHLQMFDSLSLWFCCAERSASQRVTTPEGIELILEPVARERETKQAKNGQRKAEGTTCEVRISPWPLNVDTHQLTAAGWYVPAQHYNDAASLFAARKPARLVWQVVPS